MVFYKSCQNKKGLNGNPKIWRQIPYNNTTFLLSKQKYSLFSGNNNFFILKWFSSPENKKLQKTLVVFYLHFPLFFAGDTVHQEKWPRTGSWAGPRWGQFCPKTLSKAKEEGEAVDNFDHPLDEHNTYHCPKQKGVWPPRAWPNFKISHAVCPLPRELCSGQVKSIFYTYYILFSNLKAVQFNG